MPVPTEANLPRVNEAPVRIPQIKRTDLYGREGALATRKFGDIVSDTSVRLRNEMFDEERRAAFTDIATNYVLEQQKALEDAQTNAAPGAKGFFTSYAATLKASNDSYFDGLKARFDLRQSDLDNIRSKIETTSVPFLGQASAFERHERRSFYVDQTNKAFETMKVAIANGKLAPDLARAQADTMLENASGLLDPGEKRKLKTAMYRQIGIAELERRIKQEPAATLKALSGGGLATALTEQGVRASDIARAKRLAEKEIRHRNAVAAAAARAQRDQEFREFRDEATTGARDLPTLLEVAGKRGLTRSQLATLKKDYLRGARDREKKQRFLALGERLMATGAADPKSKDHRDALEFYHKVDLKAQADTIRAFDHRDMTDAEVTAANIRLAKRANYIPKPFLSSIRGGLRAGDPLVAVKAADAADALVQHNAHLGAQLGGQNLKLAMMISQNLRSGVKPDKAVELARKAILEAGDPEIKQRENYLSRNAKDVRVRIQSAAARSFQGGADRLRGEFEQLYRQFYIDTGDETVARDLTIIAMKRVWGRSNINGGAWMRHAPEVIYRRNKDDKADWQKKQLIKDLQGLGVTLREPKPKQISGTPLTKQEGPTLRIEVTPESVRMRDANGELSPYYRVLIRQKDGSWKVVTRKDGTPVLWRPRWEDTDEYAAVKKMWQRQQKDAAKAYERAREAAKDMMFRIKAITGPDPTKQMPTRFMPAPR